MMGVGTNVWGDEVHGKSPYIPLSVAVILKPTLKKKFYSFKITFCDPFMMESRRGGE